MTRNDEPQIQALREELTRLEGLLGIGLRKPETILPVPVLAEPLAMPANTGTNTNSEARESINNGNRVNGPADSRGGQKFTPAMFKAMIKAQQVLNEQPVVNTATRI